MSVTEMKKLIVEKLEQVTDEQLLEQVLQLLNEKAEPAIDATRYMEQLFAENDNLLKRLA